MQKQMKWGFNGAGLLVVMILIIFSVGIIGMKLPAYIPLLVSLLVSMLFLRLFGAHWDELQAAMLAGLKTGLAPLFLFLLIGMLIALWMATGVIPTLVWFGFKGASATWFLPSTVLVTAVIGSVIGSAFTTIGTVGVALMGIGTSLGFSPALVAGAILSGAIFGDKSSPLSDSTNLAASIAEVDLFAHIRNLMWTTLPALGVSLLLFTWLGFGHHGHAGQSLASLMILLHPTWWSVIPLGLLVVMAILRIPAIPTLLMNVGVSALAFLVQNTPQDLADLLMNGYHTSVHNSLLAGLLNRGGMLPMMSTIIIIMFALALGGVLTEMRVLQTLMEPLVAKIKTTAGTLTGLILSGIGANFMIGEQYLATILPGQLWKPAFDSLKISRLALSRGLEDSGTVVNYLVPWGVAGSFAAQALGVSVSAFAPYVFFALFSPIFSLLSAWTGLGLPDERSVK
ncbi:hypothetical protein IV73_GL000829 [Weissella kandleri]|uniref:Na+/H+ antiporter NhaC-like C-terminal domain-containing protein n=1 Tax=Weissella kandleri TaxID=1616 RepID=A0A0R2JM91_9LACO|nr:Na+/H+ antiporter NhaC family protein [Weissella kandleri]KRN75069.1 hypothetical protein IV73_GL000829 [Weissella kandleri]